MSDTPIFDQLKREYWLMDFMDAQVSPFANFQRRWIEWAMNMDSTFEQVLQTFHETRSQILEVGHAALKAAPGGVHIDFRDAGPVAHYQINGDGRVRPILSPSQIATMQHADASLVNRLSMSRILGIKHQGIIFDEVAPSYPWEDIHVGGRAAGKSRALEEARSQDEELRRIQEDLSMRGLGVALDLLRKVAQFVGQIEEFDLRRLHRDHPIIHQSRRNPNTRIRKPQTRALGRPQTHRSRR